MFSDDATLYTVLGDEHGDWRPQSRTPVMQAAWRAAEDLVASRRFPRVRVEKRFRDPASDRIVTATIVTRVGAG